MFRLFSQKLFIKEKNVESSKRSLPALESEEPMLSLVKMFIKLKAEGFDIRPTRNDKVLYLFWKIAHNIPVLFFLASDMIKI